LTQSTKQPQNRFDTLPAGMIFMLLSLLIPFAKVGFLITVIELLVPVIGIGSDDRQGHSNNNYKHRYDQKHDHNNGFRIGILVERKS